MKKSGKIKNATPLEYNGVNYRSKLEAYMAKLLTDNNIQFSYETLIIPLIPTFTFGKEVVRGATYKPDFIVDGHIIECKGYPNDSWGIRCKLAKKYFSESLPDIQFHIPRNQKECQGVISKILHSIKCTKNTKT